MHTIRLLCSSLLVLVGFKAAAVDPVQQADIPKERRIIARYTKTPIKMDGRLDDPAWKDAPAYPMCLANQNLQPAEPREGGKVRFLWNEEYLYIGADFTDSDVVAEGKNDQEHHYRTGDLLEVFLKPDNETWYWELYATPHNKKTTFFFPGRGRLGLPSMEEYRCDLKVAAYVDGTLNNWEDRDKGWTAEMAVPVKALTARGEKFGPEANWRVLIGRYNYSRYLPAVEHSACPQLRVSNFHNYEEYGYLTLEK